ncbi:MAG: penicillin-binding protein activator LpoB [Spirochaetaceae bacterium]|nr:penicillin-binding protein activator LpoB [Spirochaetaceae bacterium]
MNKSFRKLVLLFCIASLVMFTSCSSTPDVKRVSTDTITDLSGYWNDTDVRIVAESLVKDCVNAPAIANYIRNNGKLPIVIVGNFRNDSDEHIDTSILSKKFETALINSGKVDFVASSSERGEIRQEREEQQEWASESTAKRLANETGADFMLIGSVKTMVDQNQKKMSRTYWVYAELIDIESNRKLWLGENSEIKKIITRSSVRL